MPSLRRILAFIVVLAFVSVVAVTAACSTAPQREEDRRALSADTAVFVGRAKEADPTLARFFTNCAGYAVMPEIGKGGLIVGGAYGKGQLFDRQGRLIGYCDVSQGTLGAQIGGQSFGEIIFFENDRALTEFKDGKFALAAQASAVALTSGAAAAAKYDNGVALFIMNPKGLMLEASVGGQQFGYQALANGGSMID